MVKKEMGWAIRGLLIFLVLLMVALLVFSVPSVIDPEFQLLGTYLILIIGVNLMFALLVLFRFNKN
ncbi:MAG: hypothetical protein ACXAEF_10740 [Candidatus Thorarchaeota archaeon]